MQQEFFLHIQNINNRELLNLLERSTDAEYEAIEREILKRMQEYNFASKNNIEEFREALIKDMFEHKERLDNERQEAKDEISFQGSIEVVRDFKFNK